MQQAVFSDVIGRSRLVSGLSTALLCVVAIAIGGTRDSRAAAPYISEFVANNSTTLTDDFGTKPDWIEIHNPDTVAVNLLGYYLTDDKLNPKKWAFPSVTLGAGARLIVFASNRNLTDPTPPHKLHTNFKLSESGEYLALTHPESSGSVTLLTEFDPFPIQFKDVAYGTPANGGAPFYLNSATPGTSNSTAKTTLGPLIYSATTQPPARPLGTASSPPILITAEVRPSINPVASVKVAWRVMYGAETITPMLDNGSGGDAVAGDGIFSAQIPTSGVGPGQMIRWRIIATDSVSTQATQPPYSSLTDSDQYFGTVALDTAIATQLPIVCTFMQDTINCDTTTGTRCSMYFKEQFYDNVFIAIHGQTTQSFPKKSNGINFNSDNSCDFFDGASKVKGINLLSNYQDKSKSRVALSWEFTGKLGSYGHLSFPVRVQRNGAFYEIADAMEQGDEVFLARIGLDPDGALYKIYNDLSSTSSAEKKTRVNENYDDLQAVVTNLDPALALANRRKYLYDNFNIPQCIAYFAAMSTISDWDTGDKNMYMYRDTNASGDWCMLPWDLDLSWGREWYGDDTIYNNNGLTYKPTNNRLFNMFYTVPELKMMYMRRLRTDMDEVLQPPGTSSATGIIETRLRYWLDQMDPPGVGVSDADMDFQNWPNWGNGNNMRTEAQRIFDNHLPGRRSFLYTQNPTLNGEPIPGAQVAHPALTFDVAESNPASGNQDQEYLSIKNSNAFAVDMSGWTIAGSVSYTFKPGTVIPPGGGVTENVGLLYVVRNPKAFRQRTTGPRAGQFCFVQGPYDGQLSGRGASVSLFDKSGTLIATKTIPANPTRSQQSLRITELNYAPGAPTAAELTAMPAVVASDFEFIELTNLGAFPIDLSGAVISKGVDFTFPTGITLNAGKSIVVVGNLSAFQLRYGVTPKVAGQFTGNLDNTGETLTLTDSSGEQVEEFTYDGAWLPITNKGGYSLVARAPASTPYDGYSEPTAWAISSAIGGTPGTLDPYYSVMFKSWLNDNFTLTEQLDSALGGATADPDGDGRTNNMEYLLGTNPRLPDAAQLPTWAPLNVDGADYGTITFNRRAHALDINLVVEAAVDPNLSAWIPAGTMVGDPESGAYGMESVVFRDDAPLSQGTRVLRLRDTISGATWIARIPQTLTFDGLADMPFPPAPLTLAASSNSGLPVALVVVSGPATLTGTSLQITGVGTVTISANQTGNDGFLPAVQIVRSFVVSKRDQAIDFPALDDRPFTLEPIALTVQATSQLPVVLSLVTGAATLDGSTLTLTDTGPVTVLASQAGNDIYNPASVQRSFNVTKGQQVIMFGAVSGRRYLDPPVDLTATSSAGFAVTLQVVSGPGVLNGHMLTITGAGTIVVKADQPGDSRVESAATVVQSIEVDKAITHLTWSQPADVPSGTVLSAAQLNAVAAGPNGISVPGTFVYTPPAGTILQRNDGMGLAVQFTPADSANYESADANTFERVLNSAPQFESAPSIPSDFVTINVPVSFVAAATDGDGDDIAYAWDFGDGHSADGVAPSHTYTQSGIYTATVTASDGHGGTVTASITVSAAAGFSVSKAAVALNFIKVNADKIVVSGKLPAFAGWSAGYKSLQAEIGGQLETAVFDGKGKTKTAELAMSVSAAKNGVSTFTLTWSKSRFLLTASGFVNSTVKNQPAALPVVFKVGTDVFQGGIPMTYTATIGKKGAGKFVAPKK